MIKMKKIVCLFLPLVLCLTACTAFQKSHFQLKLTNKENISYDFESYGVQQIKLQLVEAEDNKTIEVIPLGSVGYESKKKDKGTIDFKKRFVFFQ